MTVFSKEIELRTVDSIDETGKKVMIVVGRLAEMRIIDPNTKIVLTTTNIPYGSKLYFNSGDTLKKGDVVCEWDRVSMPLSFQKLPVRLNSRNREIRGCDL